MEDIIKLQAAVCKHNEKFWLPNDDVTRVTRCSLYLIMDVIYRVIQEE